MLIREVDFEVLAEFLRYLAAINNKVLDILHLDCKKLYCLADSMYIRNANLSRKAKTYSSRSKKSRNRVSKAK